MVPAWLLRTNVRSFLSGRAFQILVEAQCMEYLTTYGHSNLDVHDLTRLPLLSNLRGTKPLLLGFRSGMSWNLDPARFADNEAGFQTVALRFFALTIHSRHYQLSRQFADLANGLFDGGQ